MLRIALRIARNGLASLALAVSAVVLAASAAAALDAAPQLLPPLERPPLDPPLRITGSFGELRGGHFHGGVDFSTGGSVGKPVYAPLSGHIERIRTSGVGYGRSLYLRSRDGRLLVFGHLDAFIPEIARYAAAAQDSTGQYEQDLWPEATHFPIHAGQQLAWSGRSGTGPPHLHFEVRLGDVAYNPLRAGVALMDTIAPTIARLTLEPLDDTSFVNRGAAPLTISLSAKPETLVLQGRARAIVEALDGTDGARRSMATWEVGFELGGTRVTCRYDSVSWASDMSEVDYVYDRGRSTPATRTAVMLWAPRGMRPVVLSGISGAGQQGTIALAGDGPRTLSLTARDVAGHVTVREIVLRPPRAQERGPDPAIAGGAAHTRALVDSASRFDFVSLPDRHLRIRDLGAPAGSRNVMVETDRTPPQPASFRDGVWSAVLPEAAVGGAGATHFVVRVNGTDAHGAKWNAATPPLTLLPIGNEAAARLGAENGVEWRMPQGAAFEDGVLIAEPPQHAAATPELAPVGLEVPLGPSTLPLRRNATITMALPPGVATTHVGLYQDTGDGWELEGARVDSVARTVSADSRQVGRFALFTDTRAPAIKLVHPPHHRRKGAYSTWALEAKLTDLGSGVDARASRLVVDGEPRASEWDAEQGKLRWRPLAPPAKGKHSYKVIATDHAGNQSVRAGSFVLN